MSRFSILPKARACRPPAGRTWHGRPFGSVRAAVGVVLGCLGWAGSLQSGRGDVLLGTDFTGRVVTGGSLTVTNLQWEGQGVADPGSLTVISEPPGVIPGLFDTPDAQGHLAPDRNVGNEGPWSVDIPLVLASDQTSVTLERLEFDWRHFNNSGEFQTAARSVDWSVRVTGSVSGLLPGSSLGAPGVDGLSGAVTLTFTPALALGAGEDYVLNLRAEGATTTGNNTGLDALAIHGMVHAVDPDAPPEIVTQPAGEWDGGTDVVFTVAASGPGPLTFQWLLDGEPLAGATSDRLVLPFAQWDASGNYTVRVTNANGSVESEVARLEVTFPVREHLTYEPAGPASRRSGIAISEILYHPARRTDGRELEFVELYNSQPWPEDLSGWRLSGDIDFTFPAGTTVPAFGYLVVARAPGDVEAEFGVAGVLGPWSGNLPNDGGRVRLRRLSDAIVQQVDYDDRPPWPFAADGTGHSLVMVRASHGEGTARAWAASAWIGGSPGAADPLVAEARDHVFVSAVLSNSPPPGEDYLELRNAAPFAVGLGGCTLSDARDTLQKFTVPMGVAIPGHDTIRLRESELGFALDSAGDAIYLTEVGGTRVLDAVRLEPTAPNVPLVRLRSDAPLRPAAPPQVVINELMFHPPTRDEEDEWIEIHNVGTTSRDLGGWMLTDGVDFVFPAGTHLAPGGFLVVARNRARTLANHPALDPAIVIGDYSGNLANGGERVALARPDEDLLITVDEVVYADSDRWHRFADGRGATLERRDPRGDSLAASNWADSDESGKAAWTTIEATGTLAHGNPAAPADQLQLFLLGPGEALVDQVEVIPRGSSNLLTNGGFEAGSAGWFFQGTHRRSRVESGGAVEGNRALRLVATRRGDPGPNRVRAPLGRSLAAGSQATLRARVRWMSGHPEFLMRFKGNWLEAAGRLDLPTNLGTPGQTNSRVVANAGPHVEEVTHRPVRPSVGEPIRVFAAVSDSDGVGRVLLRYRRDPSRVTTDLPMRDDGVAPDLSPGDGIFSGEIPPQATGALLAFQVVAEDAAAGPAEGSFPPEGEGLVRVGSPAGGRSFASYRMWITQADLADWDAQPFRSNDPFPVTFIYNDVRPVYAAGAYYGGNRDSHGDPLSGSVSYDVRLPPGVALLGSDKLTLDFPVRDPTNQREQLMHWFADQLHLPTLHRRDIYLFMNGVARRDIYHDAEQPDEVVVGSHFPGDDGELFKTSNDNETTDDGVRIRPFVRNMLDVFEADGRIRTARYRWTTAARARGSRTRLDDSSIIELMRRADDTGPDYEQRLLEIIDMENWMRTFALIDLASFWDAFGNPNWKNTYLHKPTGGRWVQFTWDFDVGLGVFNDPPDQELFPGNVDANIQRMYQTPGFVRDYWRAMDEALRSFFHPRAVTPILDARSTAYQEAGLRFTSPFQPSGPYNLSVPQWISQRGTYIRRRLLEVDASFAVTGPPDGLSTPEQTIQLGGTAPVRAAWLEVNGIRLEPDWESVTAWSAPVVLQPGVNDLLVRAFSSDGTVLASEARTVTYTGTGGWPGVVINEWMATNQGALADPADGDFEDWIELSYEGGGPVDLEGWYLGDDPLDPYQFRIPAGFRLPASGYLLLWADGEMEQNAPATRPDLHLPFRLNGAGESILLSAPDGTLVDRVDFGRQAADKSMGRLTGETVALADPSPTTANGRAAVDPAVTLESGDGTVTLTVVTEPGYPYTAEASLDLETWEALETETATGETLRFVFPVDREERFYRVRRTP